MKTVKIAMFESHKESDNHPVWNSDNYNILLLLSIKLYFLLTQLESEENHQTEK